MEFYSEQKVTQAPHLKDRGKKTESFKNCEAHCVKSPYQRGKATVAGWLYWVIPGSVKSASWVKFKWSLVVTPGAKRDADTV